MAKLEDYKKTYQQSTAKASEITRQLALAGIAIIWLFKITDSNGHETISNEFIYPLCFLIATLGLDLMQYVIKGLIWYIFYKYYEHRIEKNNDIKAHEGLPIIIHLLYWTKIILLIMAYYKLFFILRDMIGVGN